MSSCSDRFRFSALLATFLLLSPVVSEALPSGVFQVASSGGTITCGKEGSRYLSGSLVRNRFTSYKTQIKLTKALMKKAATAKKKAALAAKIAKLQALAAARDGQCKNGPPKGIGGTPTPKPTVTATPKPGGTPVPTTGHFDAQGNLTASGKAAFGVPSRLNGNVGRGQTVHNNFACAACHAPKPGKTFSYLRGALSVSPMLLTPSKLGDGQLADLTAYMNRNNK